MSGQLIELIIFAGIAFFVINKLVSILGTTSEEDNNKRSFFGENSSKLKDVTATVLKTETKSGIGLKTMFSGMRNNNLKGLVNPENVQQVQKGLTNVINKVPNFDIHKFIKGARIAFEMIIESYNQNGDALVQLIDKRYLEQFKSIATGYGQYLHDSSPKIEILEVYMFGNNIFIKILFTGRHITSKITDFHEEWTFTKSTTSDSAQWYLSNIDKL